MSTIANAGDEGVRWVKRNIRVKRGASYSKALRYSLTVSNVKTPLNLTNYTATLTVKVNGRTTLTLTQTSGITLGGSAGTIVFAFTSSQTASLPVGRHPFYLEVVSPAGEEIPVWNAQLIAED